MRISYIQYPVNKYCQEAHALHCGISQAGGRNMEGLIDNPLGPLLLRPNSPPGFLSQPGVCLAIVNGRFAPTPGEM